jgi:hypothetical protein
MTSWQPFNRGRSIGTRSPEGGVIVRDEEHPLGVRITLKEAREYISISCQISGQIDHSRFFTKLSDAQSEYDVMKDELVKVVKTISLAKSSNIKAWEAIAAFVSRFQ